MSMTEAIAYKIIQYCQQENISINQFALKCELTQSTIQNIVNGKSKNVKINTLCHICYGMNMTLYDFYQDKIFDKIQMNL